MNWIIIVGEIKSNFKWRKPHVVLIAKQVLYSDLTRKALSNKIKVEYCVTSDCRGGQFRVFLSIQQYALQTYMLWCATSARLSCTSRLFMALQHVVILDSAVHSHFQHIHCLSHYLEGWILHSMWVHQPLMLHLENSHIGELHAACVSIGI